MTAQPVEGRLQGGAAALVVYRLGGREYPVRTVGQCKVCQSPHRFSIESEIASGRAYRRIQQDLLLADANCDLSTDNLGDHFRNGHMPMEVEAGRRIMERRARDRGHNIESGIESLVDGMALAEMVAAKTIEALQRGEIKPDIRDGLMAARLLETFSPVEDGIDQNTYAEAFMVFHEVAQGIMTPGQFEEFGRLLGTNATLKALVSRYDGEHVEPESEESPEEETLVTGLGILDNDTSE